MKGSIMVSEFVYIGAETLSQVQKFRAEPFSCGSRRGLDSYDAVAYFDNDIEFQGDIRPLLQCAAAGVTPEKDCWGHGCDCVNGPCCWIKKMGIWILALPPFERKLNWVIRFPFVKSLPGKGAQGGSPGEATSPTPEATS